jgi:hypothetical protein
LTRAARSDLRGSVGATTGLIASVSSVEITLLFNIVLHEVDRQWRGGDGTMSNSPELVRYVDDMVQLAGTEAEARQAWSASKASFAALRWVW